MRFIGADEIRQKLTYPACIGVMREAMSRLSSGKTRQMLRNILPLDEGRMFGVMAGTLGPGGPFGSKLVCVTPERSQGGPPSHQGAVVIFDPASGAPLCQLEAGMVTAIRTASASALATDVLARQEARTLAILGTGEQAYHHALALSHVRAFKTISVWGRSSVKAELLSEHIQRDTGIECRACAYVEAAVSGSDVICTVTAASEPILSRDWVCDGAHVNVVGSSFDGPREIGDDLVSAARFYADSEESVRAQGAEFRHALASGVIAPEHLLGEIGQVLLGQIDGRQTDKEITIYKSLGHIVQDIAAGYHVYQSLSEE